MSGLLHKVNRTLVGREERGKDGEGERQCGGKEREGERQAAVMTGRPPTHTNRGTANKDASVDRSLDQRLQQRHRLAHAGARAGQAHRHGSAVPTGERGDTKWNCERVVVRGLHMPCWPDVQTDRMCFGVLRATDTCRLHGSTSRLGLERHCCALMHHATHDGPHAPNMRVVRLGQQADDAGALLRRGGQHKAQVEHRRPPNVVGHVCLGRVQRGSRGR